MKFKYNLKNNLYKMYNEANYLVAYKKHFLNEKKTKVKNFIDEYIIYFIISTILLIISKILNANIICIILFSLISLICLFIMLNYIIAFNNYKKQNHKGIITINKDGISDKSDIDVTFSWDNVELISVTKNALIIVVNNPFVLILEPDDKILNEIKKYKDVKVIYNKEK